MSSIKSLIYRTERGMQKRFRCDKPLVKDLEEQIYFISLNCLINGETDVMKNEAAIVIGYLYQGNDIILHRRKALFDQLKRGLQEIDNQSTSYLETLGILTGLAFNQTNLPEIDSNNFLQTIVQLTRSSNPDIKSLALEFMLNILYDGDEQIEDKIRLIMDEFSLMDLIGDIDAPADILIKKRIMKWYQSPLLQILNDAYQKRYLVFHSKEELRIKILNEQLIPILIQLLNIALIQIVQYTQNKQYVPVLTMGLINSCCSIIIEVVKCNFTFSAQIEQSDIIERLIDILNHIPITKCKYIHIHAIIFCYQLHIRDEYLQKLYKFGGIKTLSRFIKHQSSSVVRIVSYSILAIVMSVNSLCYSHSIRTVELPLSSKCLIFNELQNDDIITHIEECSVDRTADEEILLNWYQTLSMIYRGRIYPSNTLALAIPSLKKSIAINLLLGQSISHNISVLQNLATNHANHNCIMNSGIIHQLIQCLNYKDLDLSTALIEFLCILYENGNENTRLQIRNSINEEQFGILINRKNVSEIYNKSRVEQISIYGIELFKYFKLKRVIFVLQAWQQEKEKMEKLSTIRNEIQQLNEYKDNKQRQNNKLQNNGKDIQIQFQKVNDMILIAQRIKDKELAIGAMQLMREGIYIILFQLSKSWKEKQLCETIDQLKQIIQSSDDETCFNIIDTHIYQCLDYIINKCDENKTQQLQLKEKAISLAASIAERGAQMGNNDEINYFFQFLLGSGLIYLIEKNLKFEQFEQIKDQEIKKMKENIRFQTVAFICCMRKMYESSEINLFICGLTLNNTLKNLTQSLLNLSKEDNYNHQQKGKSIEISNQSNIDNIIETIIQALTSVGYLASQPHNAMILFNSFQIYELIIPFIHTNCDCPLRITINKTLNVTKLISSAYYALSNLIQSYNGQGVYETINNNNILDHISYLILSCEKPNFKGSSTQYSITEESNLITQRFIPSILIRESVRLLGQLSESPQILIKIPHMSNLIQILIQLAYCGEINGESSPQQSQIQYNCLIVIYSQVNSQSFDLAELLIREMNLIQKTSDMICIAGGQSSKYEYITSINLGILSKFYKILKFGTNQQSAQQLFDQLLQKTEEQGLREEDDALIFHSDFHKNRSVSQMAHSVKDYFSC